ncbi:MAG: hypothetical protein IBJ11_01585 [Phycisphaerales bacterium]|nr:hypothetical protein [Phycisphaerales bacterium]
MSTDGHITWDWDCLAPTADDLHDSRLRDLAGLDGSAWPPALPREDVGVVRASVPVEPADAEGLRQSLDQPRRRFAAHPTMAGLPQAA